MTLYSSTMIWWMVSISWSAIFLIVVSFYLYWKGPRPQSESSQGIIGKAKDFIFVWILTSLLVLYIYTINNSSAVIFAAGNIIVEVILVVYTVRNRAKKT